jgi:hypothetical protein
MFVKPRLRIIKFPEKDRAPKNGGKYEKQGFGRRYGAIAGFFTTGTSAMIPSGANVKGFVDEDVPLTFASAAPAPLAVAATPAASAMNVPAAVAATASSDAGLTSAPPPTATRP